MKLSNQVLPFCVSGFIHLSAFFLANSYLNFDITFKKEKGIAIPVKIVLSGNQHNKAEIKKSNLDALKKAVENNNLHKPLIKTTLSTGKTSENQRAVDFRQAKTEGNEKAKLLVEKAPRSQTNEELEIAWEMGIAPEIILKEKTAPKKINIMGKLVQPETLSEITGKPDVEEKAAIEPGGRIKTIAATISEKKNVSGIQVEIEKDLKMHTTARVERGKSEAVNKTETDISSTKRKEKIVVLKKMAASGESTKRDLMIEAITVNLKKPGYPRVSRKRNEEGKVILSVEVLKNGEPGEIEVISSSGYSRLDLTAVKALEQAVFISAKIEGKPVVSIKQIAFTFKLEDS